MRGRAKALRKSLTVSEQRLWNWLRNRSFSGYKFRRQVPIDRFVVDFYCAELRLAIEVDGRHHETEWNGEYDTQRTLNLRTRGIEVVRVANKLLAKDALTAEVIIRDAIDRRVAQLARF
jgi:very-short-patch-repair endonuclease